MEKIPKNVGARAQPCLTPLRMSNGPDELLLNCTVPWCGRILSCSVVLVGSQSLGES